jgi:hypothetical protein
MVCGYLTDRESWTAVLTDRKSESFEVKIFDLKTPVGDTEACLQRKLSR